MSAEAIDGGVDSMKEVFEDDNRPTKASIIWLASEDDSPSA
jgi:hypothetical protein